MIWVVIVGSIVVWMIGLITTAVIFLEIWDYAPLSRDRHEKMLAAIGLGIFWPVLLAASPIWGVVPLIHHITMNRHQKRRNQQ